MSKRKPKKQTEEQVITETIIELPMDEIMGDRFGNYSKYVIQNRAIPDARDGLKPVQRRIIYAMHDEGNTFNKPMKKCAHTVGAVMGKYHPHGDTSIYDALARMSQEWSMRYPLIDFQGNNGSIDGDEPAAYRYTESRLNELSNELVLDINKKTVNMNLTFDDTSFEPEVLPSRFPNLLVNGSQGIAVGVATEIPPHNLREVVDAIIHRITYKRSTIEDMRKYILGPDFPTGGVIYKGEGLDSIYETGRGRVEMEALATIESDRTSQRIVITEVPYQSNKSQILRELGAIEQNRNVDGVVEVRDESDRNGIRIVIELKKEANTDVILEYIFSKTRLRAGYNANIVAIADNRPKTLNILDLIDAYISHQVDVITRRSEFDLATNEKRLHIIEGLIKAISVVNEIIAIIRKSTDKANAKTNIKAAYGFSEEQAEAIVMLQLYKLSNTDITVLMEEKAAIETTIDELRNILSNEKALNNVIIRDLKRIAQKFGDDRRTKIREKGEVVQIDKRDLIADEQVMLALTRDGYIKRSSLKSYRSSGDFALPGVKSSDLLIAASEVNTKDFLVAFTNLGNYLYIPIYEIGEGRWKDEGKHINYIVQLNANEKIIKAFNVKEFREDLYFAIATRNGMIKRTSLNEFVAVRYSRPLQAMRLLSGDRVADVTLTTGNSELLVITESGAASFYNENEITVVSVKASGVKSINKKKADKVVALISVDPEVRTRTCIVTSEGHLRLLDHSYFEATARLGRLQHVMRTFKSDPHTIVSAFRYNRNIEELRVYALTDANVILPLLLTDLAPTPVDKYAKRNINELAEEEKIVSIFNEEIPTISEETKAYAPIVKAEAVKVEPVEDSYEQISIFDLLDED
ncbi:MAG: DNA topoisomerase IV subunit A [Bacilli bacterium]|jgi:topoisomerase-4 subunit A|nr:DNA topoisomerase IV subunit A [Bacillota bacterium]NLI51846.1 DNA topoisomerase IV subunit A [Erysipelotrichaceae bacterium]OQC50623.1 MAG: DNA topoisomerase 4 subunit A [Tenericutes bacterium ADurb.Bin024]HOE53636.1 DNA topoisomerase IV subunit A [Bacilli bacterium]HOM32460.1 DNA topoisomerase IV subunit A [Bacilli bacterium]